MSDRNIMRECFDLPADFDCDACEYAVEMMDLNHKINRKAMLVAQIKWQERACSEAREFGNWITVDAELEQLDRLYEAFEETLHALPGDRVSRYSSIVGAITQWEDEENVSRCLSSWRKRNGLIDYR